MKTLVEAIDLVRRHNSACDDYYRNSTKTARKRLAKVNKELIEALTGEKLPRNEAAEPAIW